MRKVKIKTLAVEDDQDILNYIKSSIDNMQDKRYLFEITTFEDSRESWEALQKHRYDLIVLDWKMPHISGMALVNRIRQSGQYQFTPIIVATGFLEMKDFRLLDEYPFIALVEKPFTSGKLGNTISALYLQFEKFKKQVELVDRLLQQEPFDGEQIEALCKKMLSESKDQVRTVLHVARRTQNLEQHELALDLYRLVLKHDNSSTQALTELGKEALRDRDMEKAKTYLFQAQQRSPQNLERLCLLGQVSLEQIKPDQALIHFGEAKAIDPSNSKVTDGLKLAETLKEITEGNRFGIDLSHNFASMMNAVGIALSVGGNPKGGIEHYIAAMTYALNVKSKARLAFNVGLGFLREKNPLEGASWFEMASSFDPSFEKAQNYLAKLKSFSIGDIPENEEDPISSHDDLHGDVEEKLIKKTDYKKSV